MLSQIRIFSQLIGHLRKVDYRTLFAEARTGPGAPVSARPDWDGRTFSLDGDDGDDDGDGDGGSDDDDDDDGGGDDDDDDNDDDDDDNDVLMIMMM